MVMEERRKLENCPPPNKKELFKNRFSEANDVITMVKEEESLKDRLSEVNDVMAAVNFHQLKEKEPFRDRFGETNVVINMVKEEEPLKDRLREANGMIAMVIFHQLKTLTSQGFVKSNINSYIMKSCLLSWLE